MASAYPFRARFVSEMLSMTIVIVVGCGAIANNVLTRTKGHGLGLGNVAIAWGMAFFISIGECLPVYGLHNRCCCFWRVICMTHLASVFEDSMCP